MELLGGLLVLAAIAWVGLSICAGGLCAEQDAAQPLLKQENTRIGFSCWDKGCDVNAINRLVCGNDVY